MNEGNISPGAAPGRVAILGKRNLLHWDEHVADGFADLGWRVTHHQVNRRPPWLAAARGVLKLARGSEAGGAASDTRHAEHILRALRRTRPDVVVCVSVFFLPLTFLKALHSLSPRPAVVGLDGDALVRFEGAQAYTGLLDALFVTENTLVERAGTIAPRAGYLSYAANPRVYRDTGASRRPRVYFCGARTDAREAAVRAMGTAPISLRGPGWGALAGELTELDVRAGKLSMQRQAEDYASHLMVWNQHQAANNPVSSLNMRDFEAPAAGALLLSDYRADFEQHYDVERELLVYRDVSELGDLLARSLVDAPECARRARRAAERVRAEHTYAHRARRILDSV